MAEINYWENKYREMKNLWGTDPEYMLIKYKSKIAKGVVLDVGIGEGRNISQFALDGFEVEGVDISGTAVKKSKELLGGIGCNANIQQQNIKDFEVDENKYSLIIAAWVLNFFKKSEIKDIIEKLKKGLKNEGIIYLSVFTVDDPSFKDLNNTCEQIERNTFYIEDHKSFVHYFTKQEVLHYFNGFETISYIEGIDLDDGHGTPHYHGYFEYMGINR